MESTTGAVVNPKPILEDIKSQAEKAMSAKLEGKLGAEQIAEMQRSFMSRIVELREAERSYDDILEQMERRIQRSMEGATMKWQTKLEEKRYIMKDIRRCKSSDFDAAPLGLASVSQFQAEAPEHLRVGSGKVNTSKRMAFEIYKRGELANYLETLRKKRKLESGSLIRFKSKSSSLAAKLQTICKKAGAIAENLFPSSSSSSSSLSSSSTTPTTATALASATPSKNEDDARATLVPSNAGLLPPPLFVLCCAASSMRNHEGETNPLRISALKVKESDTADREPTENAPPDMLMDAAAPSNDDDASKNNSPSFATLMKPHPISLILCLEYKLQQQWRDTPLALEFRYHPGVKMATVRPAAGEASKMKAILDRISPKDDEGKELIRGIKQAYTNSYGCSEVAEEENWAKKWAQTVCGLDIRGSDGISGKASYHSLREVLIAIRAALNELE
eukprot:jgi/Bigna1/74973/fgenesh1_pg.32_\